MLSVATIFGVNVGFEIMPKSMALAVNGGAKWGLLLDLFCVRFMYVKV